MTVITKTNERDERKQIGDALAAIEADVTQNAADIAQNTIDIGTNTSAISALDGRITALEGGVDGTPPTALVGRPTVNGDLELTLNNVYGTTDTTASSSTYDQWTTLLTVASGSGVIEFLNVWQSANTSDRDWMARLAVDGTVVWTSHTQAWRLAAENTDGFSLIGTGASSSSTPGSAGAIAFTTSFLLEFKKTENAAGTVTAGATYSYRST